MNGCTKAAASANTSTGNGGWNKVPPVPVTRATSVVGSVIAAVHSVGPRLGRLAVEQPVAVRVAADERRRVADVGTRRIGGVDQQDVGEHVVGGDRAGAGVGHGEVVGDRGAGEDELVVDGLGEGMAGFEHPDLGVVGGDVEVAERVDPPTAAMLTVGRPGSGGISRIARVHM